jgi:hypothetical protein
MTGVKRTNKKTTLATLAALTILMLAPAAERAQWTTSANVTGSVNVTQNTSAAGNISAMGRVKVKVDAARAPIKVGDLLNRTLQD